MKIPPAIVQAVGEGKAALFLGAGASIGARAEDGREPLVGPKLAKLINDRFLGGEEPDTASLTMVAALAESERDLTTLQTFIYETYRDMEPAPFHKLIPTFRWAAIVTTNYDLVVEQAYRTCKRPLQKLVPFVKTTDHIDADLRSPDTVPFIKLHGCLSRRDDLSIPLILTIDQYVTHRKNRQTLFERMKHYASEYPFIFVGHRLEDPDVRQVLLELAEEGIDRTRFYVVTPNVTDRQSRFWETKKITALPGTLEELLTTLGDALDPALRGVARTRPAHPLISKIPAHDVSLSDDTLSVLSSDLQFVRADMPSAVVEPLEFYRGSTHGWSALAQGLDSCRTLTDSVISDVVLADDVGRPTTCDFYLLKGHAGAGKTVLLKRIAWDIATEFSALALYYSGIGRIPVDAVFEIADATQERVFLFVDRASYHVPDLIHLLQRGRREGIRITVLSGERANEWNVECSALHSLVNEVFEVRYLSRREISALLEKLEANKALGVLEHSNHAERIHAFETRAGRQLLVALHEATLGKPFEDIIDDEYQNIQPDCARLIYLTVCTLNRLDVPVRAGLIRRVHGVSFEQFREKFFAPLEGLVKTIDYTGARDMAYEARHPWIADVVFERALIHVDDRYDRYVTLLNAIDIGYEADRRAFRKLLRARELLQLFPDPIMVRSLYDKAVGASGEDPYIFQQRAIFEMRRDNPNFDLAHEYLTRASRLAPKDRSVTHTLADLELIRARHSSNSLEQGRHISAAEKIARELTGHDADSSYGYHTLCKIAIDRLQEQLHGDPDDDQTLGQLIKSAERTLERGLQRFPDDEYLLEAEARLAKLIDDDQRASVALERAFKANPSSPFITKGLARLLTLQGRFTEARTVLEACLDSRPGDRGLNATLGYLLTHHFPDEGAKAEYYWARSYTKGDANYPYQFWHARQLFVNGKVGETVELFKELRNARVAFEVRNKLRGPMVGEDGLSQRYQGRVERLEETYAVVSQVDSMQWAFLHRTRVRHGAWADLTMHAPVTFKLAFTYSGLAAFDLRPE